ncbi:hypothetical protein HDK77DRAFT_511617 [Phyllosticta capitalensis]
MTSNSQARPRRRRRAPLRMFDYYRHFRDGDGYPSLSVWCGRTSLPPLFSFQVYVTYDVSEAQKSELEALAKQLHQSLLPGDLDASVIRLDLHFLGPDVSTAACVAHYQRAKQASEDDPSLRIVPSYVSAGYHSYHSFFFKLLGPEWQREDASLMSVSFDSACPDESSNNSTFMEEPSTIEGANEDVRNLYGGSGVKEDCEVVYELAQAEGLTEW